MSENNDALIDQVKAHFTLTTELTSITKEKFTSLSFGVEETNCSQCIFQLSNGHELLRFFDDINTDVW